MPDLNRRWVRVTQVGRYCGDLAWVREMHGDTMDLAVIVSHHFVIALEWHIRSRNGIAK
jgi:hypothetical protein